MLINIVDVVREGKCTGDMYFHLRRQASAGPISPVQFGYHERTPGHGFGPAVRDHYVLHFIRSGKGYLCAGDDEYEISANNLFLIRPQEITRYWSDAEDPWEYYWIGFEGEWAEEILRRIGFEDKNVRVKEMSEPEKVFEWLERTANSAFEAGNLDANFLAVFSGMLMTLETLTGHTDTVLPRARSSAGQLGTEYTRIILSIIRNSYKEQLSIQSIAEKVNLNRSYMTELFKRDMGVSIKQYLTDYRLERVKLELLKSDRSIKEIAPDCGFTDPLYLSRVFKEKYGVCPNEWRNAMRRKDGE